MDPPIRLNGCTQAIHLNLGDLPPHGFISGWGNTAEDHPVASPHLRWAKVEVIEPHDEECHEVLALVQRAPGQFCAGGENEFDNVVPCYGDSGGPLAYKHQVHGWQLASIISWSTGSARPGWPAVYMDVAYFREWILSQFPGDTPTTSPATATATVATASTASTTREFPVAPSTTMVPVPESSGAFACIARTTFLVSVLSAVWDQVL